jgi:hypothetical protein
MPSGLKIKNKSAEIWQLYDASNETQNSYSHILTAAAATGFLPA